MLVPIETNEEKYLLVHLISDEIFICSCDITNKAQHDPYQSLLVCSLVVQPVHLAVFYLCDR